MAYTWLALVFTLAISTALAADNSAESTASIIEIIRNRTNSWVPGNNPLPSRAYMGRTRWEAEKSVLLPTKETSPGDEEVELPESFDAREQWPECPSIGEIPNEGCCESYWAVSAVTVMSDRWCIHSPNRSQFTFAAHDPLACCSWCGSCDGGTLATVWSYWLDTGISSGGPFESDQGCLPYPVDVCEHILYPLHVLSCPDRCQPGHTVSLLQEDRRFGRIAYALAEDEQAIRREIFRNGPVQAGLLLYEDFLYYESGVYRNVYDWPLGDHAVKILGWGVEDGQKYWLCANSWGTDWGESGYFKIVRGENHVNIEQVVYGGLPNYDRKSSTSDESPTWSFNEF